MSLTSPLQNMQQLCLANKNFQSDCQCPLHGNLAWQASHFNPIAKAPSMIPSLAVSTNFYQLHAIPIPTRDADPMDTKEMSMKTIEMLAMIKGTTYEEAFLLDSRMSQLEDDVRISTGGTVCDCGLDCDDEAYGLNFECNTAASEEESYEPEEDIFQMDI